MKRIIYFLAAISLSMLLLCSCDLSGIVGMLPGGPGSEGGDCPHENIYYETTEPSCTARGSKVKLCHDCDLREVVEEQYALGHDFESHDGKEATCTESGFYSYLLCKRCGYSTKKTEPARGHDFAEWTVVTDATCTEDGIRRSVCSGCDEVSEELIPKLDHTMGAWTDIIAIGGAMQMRKCKKCEFSIERETPEDNYSPTGEILSVKGGASSIVVLIHDDGTIPSIAAMDRRFVKYGLVGDAALLVDYVVEGGLMDRPRPSFEGFKQYMSNGRWSIINHSLTHRYWGDEATLTVNATTMANEVIKSGEILREIFPEHRILTFAYPGISRLGNAFGYDRVYAEIRELVAEHYVAGRGFLGPAYVDIDSVQWDMTHCGVMSDSSIDKIITDLDAAGDNNRFYVYLAHGVEDGANHNITGENFERICEKVAELVKSGAVWNAHYEDACLYLREVECATLSVTGDSGEITVRLTDTLDDEIYNYPLDVRVDLPDTYPAVRVVQGDRVSYAVAYELEGRWVADISVIPDGGDAVITKIAEEDIPTPEEPTPEEVFEDVDGEYDFEASLDGVATSSTYLTASLAMAGKNKTSSLYLIKNLGVASVAFYPDLKTTPVTPDALSLRLSVYLDENTKNSLSENLATVSLSESSEDSPYLLTLKRADGGFIISNSGENISDVISYNEWHKIKLILNNVNNSLPKVTLMVDGKTVYESDPPSENETKEVSGAYLLAEGDASFDMYIDNLTLKCGGADEMLSDKEKYDIDLNYFPGWNRKAVTFTMDDGLMEYDRHFLNIVRPAGILGTFNLYNVNLDKADEYRELYEGYGIANHCNYHPNVFKDGVTYNITDEPWPGADKADKAKVYRHPTVEGLYYHFVTGYSWHPIADTEHYLEFAMQTEREIEEIFGEGVVKGFAYPNGNQQNAKVISYLSAHGYTNIRRTYPLAGDDFSMPETRYSWSYNAMHTDFLSMMAKFEALPDDGELKMFSFGVHPKDFETGKKWEDLYLFAATYGYRPDDYFYGTVDDIFAQEDAIKDITVEDGFIKNNSRLTEIYFKVDGKRLSLSARSAYNLETGEVTSL